MLCVSHANVSLCHFVLVSGGALPLADGGAQGWRCEKQRHFLSHLYIKTNILPRQARDQHLKSKRGMLFFAGDWEIVDTSEAAEAAAAEAAAASPIGALIPNGSAGDGEGK